MKYKTVELKNRIICLIREIKINGNRNSCLAKDDRKTNVMFFDGKKSRYKKKSLKTKILSFDYRNANHCNNKKIYKKMYKVIVE